MNRKIGGTFYGVGGTYETEMMPPSILKPCEHRVKSEGVPKPYIELYFHGGDDGSVVIRGLTRDAKDNLYTERISDGD